MRDANQDASGKWFKRFLSLLLFVVIVAGMRAWRTRDLPSGEAPPVSGGLLTASQIDWAAYRGRPMLLHFWATWCGVCEAENDTINDIARDWPVLTVATSSGSDEDVRAYMNAHGLDFPVLNDTQGALATQYGIRGVPASFFLDGEGKIRFAEVGYTTAAGMRLRLWYLQ